VAVDSRDSPFRAFDKMRAERPPAPAVGLLVERNDERSHFHEVQEFHFHRYHPSTSIAGFTKRPANSYHVAARSPTASPRRAQSGRKDASSPQRPPRYAELLIIWKILHIISLTTQCWLSISPPMRAVYDANCPHITTTPALIPQAFRRHRRWRVTTGRPLHD
jgi:hypothetical protein